jgi:hypothetical protein
MKTEINHLQYILSVPDSVDNSWNISVRLYMFKKTYNLQKSKLDV